VRQAYDKTLSNYHIWAVRKAASLAFYTLPSRESFIEQMGFSNLSEAKQGIEKLVASLQPVVTAIHNTYTLYTLHNLP